MADVVLGGETASNVPIQLWNNQYASKPSSCAAAISDPSEWGSNGILGVSPGLTDCYGNSCPASGGPAYFACNAGTCSPVVPSPLQQIKNPVALLDTDNNGVTISFPSIPPGGVLSSSGTMFLGVGTRSNNVPPAGTPALKTTYEGWFNAQLNGKTFWSRMDTGTESWNIPDGTGVPLCTGPGTAGHYLCPSSPLTISLELQDISKAISEPITFQIANVEQEFGSGNFASSDMGQDWGAGISDAMILGMSFFYGKTVYFVIDGRSTSLGTGPLNAFSQNLKIQ
jgi:hypothetical protein